MPLTSIGELSTGKWELKIGPAMLTKHWNIGLEQDKQTLEETTQCGCVLWWSLVCQDDTRPMTDSYGIGNCHILYSWILWRPLWNSGLGEIVMHRCLHLDLVGYIQQRGTEVHEGLSLLVQWDGVPPIIIMDGTKEQTIGEFKRKACEMGVHVQQTEPYSLWQNAAKGATWRVSNRQIHN